MVYFTVECGNPNPHKAHSWREGFLWHRKRKCDGCPEKSGFEEFMADYAKADVEMTSALYEKLYHKHHFKGVGSDGPEYIISFVCDKGGCNAKVRMYRKDYADMLMGHLSFDREYFAWSEAW